MSLARRPTGLPSNPRARSVTGAQITQDLPSRSRSFTPAPARQDYPPRSSASERPPPSSFNYANAPPLPSQPRTLRPQRSVGSLPSRPTGSVRSRSVGPAEERRHAPSRSDPPPPLPNLPRGPKLGSFASRGNGPAHASTRSDDYNAYRTQGREGFARSPASVASSRTSMDEGEMMDKPDEKTPEGHGSSLWASITGVASNLTISVSKAWSSNIATYSGEETPVGGESRLARAMKAYHIDKARDPTELPDWLFDERERGVRSYQSTSSAPEKKASSASRPSNDLPRSNTTAIPEEPLAPARVFRGPTLADRKAESASRHASSNSGAGSEAHVTKSISRLRELRDAKRNAKVRFGDEAEDAREVVPAPPRAPIPVAPPVVARREPAQRFPPPAPATPRGMPAPLGASLGVRGRQPSMRVGLPSGVRPVRV
ncbi:hypothetical protein C8T65DRAFT_203010 [Cerioporus squamosus]|nr:hypothetical protein C8T65DRAFT_203010 [Cerioporus squamosus]